MKAIKCKRGELTPTQIKRLESQGFVVVECYNPNNVDITDGRTLLDEFAIAAMYGISADELNPGITARLCYDYAAAAMDEREARSKRTKKTKESK